MNRKRLTHIIWTALIYAAVIVMIIDVVINIIYYKMIEKEPFRKYHLNKKDRTFTIRLTDSDLEWFIPAMKKISQPKLSTAMKQLAEIGSEIVLHDPKNAKFIDIIINNDRRNKRIGVTEWDYKKDKF